MEAHVLPISNKKKIEGEGRKREDSAPTDLLRPLSPAADERAPSFHLIGRLGKSHGRLARGMQVGPRLPGPRSDAAALGRVHSGDGAPCMK